MQTLAVEAGIGIIFISHNLPRYRSNLRSRYGYVRW